MVSLFWIILLHMHVVFVLAEPTAKRKRQERASYDYVVIGCGAAGLTVATRLSEISVDTVLCIEAGSLDHNEPEITVPVYIGLQAPNFYDWNIDTTPQNQLDGLPRRVPMGKGIGGGTLINGMVWNRGNQQSYNSWDSLGNTGWSWRDLLPYFRRSETFTPKAYAEQAIPPTQFDPRIHGLYGPVQVSYPNYFWTQSNNWFEALESLGIPTVVDPNNGLAAGGYFLPLNIDPSSQTRSDARRAYYDLAVSRPNLEILPNSQVTRIIFDTDEELRAIAVEYVAITDGSLRRVDVQREMILAAGAIHTPQLLELSGIGQASFLEQVGIHVLEDLPGVGNNLQDHGLIHINYPYANRSLVTVNELILNQTFNSACQQEYYANKTGPWTAKPSQAVAFLSLQQIHAAADAMLDSASVDLRRYLPSNYEATLQAGYEAQVASVIAELRSKTNPVYEILNSNAGSLDLALVRPLSRGTCHISSTDAFDPPTVDPRWLVHPFDYDVMIAAMQFNQRLLETPGLSILQPTYVDIPRWANADQLGAFLRARIGTEYHYSGTAAMLPRELGGVVDSNLTVYGTLNVRVVDSSVFPVIPGAHLQAVVYGVAERAADMIKQANAGSTK